MCVLKYQITLEQSSSFSSRTRESCCNRKVTEWQRNMRGKKENFFELVHRTLHRKKGREEMCFCSPFRTLQSLKAPFHSPKCCCTVVKCTLGRMSVYGPFPEESRLHQMTPCSLCQGICLVSHLSHPKILDASQVIAILKVTCVGTSLSISIERTLFIRAEKIPYRESHLLFS
jgi:hypothetical protein